MKKNKRKRKQKDNEDKNEEGEEVHWVTKKKSKKKKRAKDSETYEKQHSKKKRDLPLNMEVEAIAPGMLFASFVLYYICSTYIFRCRFEGNHHSCQKVFI